MRGEPLGPRYARLDPSQVGRCFDGSAGSYDETVWRNQAGAARLIASVPEGPYERVVDVGCGTGFASEAVVQRFGPRSITGVDLSAAMLERFRARLGAAPGLAVDTREADVLDMSIDDGSVDLVVSTMAFHWFPDRAGALRSMSATLRPGGVLGILTGCDGTEEEYRQVVRSLSPAVPAALVDIYDGLVGLEEMDTLIRGAGLEPTDVWIERRRRVSSPDRIVARMRLVAGHLISELPPDEQERIWDRIGAALAASCDEQPFVYHFHKLYAVARRP